MSKGLAVSIDSGRRLGPGHKSVLSHQRVMVTFRVVMALARALGVRAQ